MRLGDAFLRAKLSIDTGELTDKGAVSQRNILRRYAGLIENLYTDNPTDDVICLDRVSEETGRHLSRSLRPQHH
jgi:feruloyl-CoA synthase